MTSGNHRKRDRPVLSDFRPLVLAGPRSSRRAAPRETRRRLFPCVRWRRISRRCLSSDRSLWRIVMVRMVSDPRTRTYVERRTREGRSKREIIRSLKRYVARQLYRHLPGVTAV